MSYLIETINLSKKFPLPKKYRDLLLHPFSHHSVTALDSISIRVRQGEIFGVLGPNGSGKTTLIKILSTLILPTEGRALISGLDVTTHERRAKERIGYVVSDERSFFWRLTGRQNLRFFCSLNNIPSPEAERKIEDIAQLTGLEKEIDNVFQNYSSGNKQKVAIARGLLTNPEILLLDEPTGSLDPAVASKLRRFIRDVLVGESGKAVLLATNNMQEAEEMCDRVAMIQNGKLIRCDTITNLKNRVKEQFVLTLKHPVGELHSRIGNSRFKDHIVAIKPHSSKKEHALVTVQINAEDPGISDFVQWLVHSGLSIETCVNVEPSLNDIFLTCMNE